MHPSWSANPGRVPPDARVDDSFSVLLNWSQECALSAEHAFMNRATGAVLRELHAYDDASCRFATRPPIGTAGPPDVCPLRTTDTPEKMGQPAIDRCRNR